MADGWTITAAVASAISAAAALWGVVLLIQAHRRQEDAETPLLEFEVSGVGSEGFALRMKATSRSLCQWKLIDLEVRRPARALIANQDDLQEYLGSSMQPSASEVVATKFAKSATLKGELYSAGTSNSLSGRGDIVWSYLVVRGEMPIEKLKLRVRLRSLEAKPRTLRRTVNVAVK